MSRVSKKTISRSDYKFLTKSLASMMCLWCDRVQGMVTGHRSYTDWINIVWCKYLKTQLTTSRRSNSSSAVVVLVCGWCCGHTSAGASQDTQVHSAHVQAVSGYFYNQWLHQHTTALAESRSFGPQNPTSWLIHKNRHISTEKYFQQAGSAEKGDSKESYYVEQWAMNKNAWWNGNILGP